jgi:hypothetical protein
MGSLAVMAANRVGGKYSQVFKPISIPKNLCQCHLADEGVVHRCVHTYRPPKAGQ